MADKDQQPATKADFASLKENFASLKTDFASVEERLIEAIRDSQTEVLRAFHG